MDEARIAELLTPFLEPKDSPDPNPAPLAPSHLKQILIYIDILLRWNARINLTAIRRPEEIVPRHFGESLFAARHLFSIPSHQQVAGSGNRPHVADLGSGAGFPGLPIKIWAPSIRLTLIEPNQKKATFLREVVRALTLTDVNVSTERVQLLADRTSKAWPIGSPLSAGADVVTLRAVESFEAILPAVPSLLAPSGRLALLIGHDQVSTARARLSGFRWQHSLPIPLSDRRVLLIGVKKPSK